MNFWKHEETPFEWAYPTTGWPSDHCAAAPGIKPPSARASAASRTRSNRLVASGSSNLSRIRITSMSTSIPMRSDLSQKIARRIFGARRFAKLRGDFRQKESFGLVDRPNYAYGLLRAADTAKFFGLEAVTVCEFGVARGNGLINMVDVAAEVTRVTGVRFRIVGFDTGAGLLPPGGPKDHPELWSSGDFAMEDPAALKRRLDGKAELILGDIADTIAPFVKTLEPRCPLGFVSIDVDVYSATVSALRGLGGQKECYLPAVSFYFDDTLFYFANERCGELAAIAEYNAATPDRPIFQDRSLPGWRPDSLSFSPWHRAMYVAHILDHPFRVAPRDRGSLSLEEHLTLIGPLR